MKVIQVIFLSLLIVIITESIAAKYLLVEVDQIKDVGMFVILKKVNTSRSHLILLLDINVSVTLHF